MVRLSGAAVSICRAICLVFDENCSEAELVPCLNLLPSYQHLTALGLTTRIPLSASFLTRLLSHMPSLSSLRLDFTGSVRRANLSFLSSVAPTLRQLHLLHSCTPTRELRHIMACERLASLRITRFFAEPIDSFTHALLTPLSPTHRQLGVLPQLRAAPRNCPRWRSVAASAYAFNPPPFSSSS
jgi:hypothetical protein